MESTHLFPLLEKTGAQLGLEPHHLFPFLRYPHKNMPHKRHDHYLKIITISSCTMNCLAPWSRLFIHVNFGIMERLMITVHTITSTLKNMDCSSRKLWHVGHGASQIIISANTDTAKTVGKIIPELNGSPTGIVFCVFTPNMSAMNLTCTLKKKTNMVTSRRC